MSNLNTVALEIISNSKGILAADESIGTMKKRFDDINIESTPENRLNFREILFSSDAIKEFIGGVILFDETIRQETNTGISIPNLITNNGAYVGIKVDLGSKKLAGSSEEKVTEGLDGLRKRFQEYYKLGARFAKWRAVYKITDKYPSKLSIKSNSHALARYGALAQESNIVPIIEPEVLMDGDHNINKCFEVTSEVLKRCYEELYLHNVDLKGTILKPNMILAGTSSADKNTTAEIAEITLKCLKNNVPKEVPGIAFLSGGQSEIEATKNLNAINQINDTNFKITFSYGRALQQSVLKCWGKRQEDILSAQKTFYHRAKMNSLSTSGEWTEDLENNIL